MIFLSIIYFHLYDNFLNIKYHIFEPDFIILSCYLFYSQLLFMIIKIFIHLPRDFDALQNHHFINILLLSMCFYTSNYVF